MITRNVFGKIEPRIEDYFIRKNSKGKYEILKYDANAHMVTNAVLNDSVMMWLPIEPFDSLVKAYAWLKKNIKNLL